jgi:hypothetical protein
MAQWNSALYEAVTGAVEGSRGYAIRFWKFGSCGIAPNRIAGWKSEL